MDEEIEKRTAVIIIKSGDKQSVVQHGDKRVVIANAKIKDSTVKDGDLKKATPYGLDFDEVFAELVLPDKNSVIDAFHGHGIWTAADVRSNPQSVLSALSSIYSPILRFLMQYIKTKKI